jgi:ketosteroid isomerase-like protein
MICAAVLSVALLTGTAADAQSWDASQKEVWTTILDSYKDIENEDLAWTDKWVTPDAKVWGSYPMPRSREAVKNWDGFNFGRSETLASEYSPAAIVVHGDMAVAHYYYSTGDKDEEGKTSVTHGKCTDILVRAEGSWRFIAWNCADMPEDD